MDIIMPQLGETVEEGTVAAWHKREGDAVSVDEPLVDIETDKVSTEVPSLVSGTLRKILVSVGQTVKVGVTLAIIDSVSGASAIPHVGPSEPQAHGRPASGAESATTAQVSSVRRHQTPGKGAPLSPAVRRLVAEHGIDVTRIQGTGRDGRIKRNDLLSHLKDVQVVSTTSQGATEVVPFSPLRKRIAEHMVRSKATSAHVLQAIEVDFSAVEGARTALRRAWKEREGASLTYLPFVARAVALALTEFPHLNAHVAGESLEVFKTINLAMAVDLQSGGLIAPVIKNVATLCVPEIARAVTRIAESARKNTLKPDDMAGGTYSLTNNGSFGTYLTAPIINQPQVAILSIDTVQRRPWVVADGDHERIEIRPVGVLAHSFDHRAIDGAYSGAYLRRLRQILESHEWAGEFLT